MSTTDLIPDVLDYLVTQCQAASAGGSLAGITVFDGQQPSAAAAGIEQVLWVGYDPMSPGMPVGDMEEEFAFLGDKGATRNETGSVVCTAKHWTGDTTMATHRDGCKAITGAVELMLRGQPSAGPGDYSLGGLVFWAQLTGASWYQQLIDDGAEALCVFKIGYFGRVTTT